LLGTYQPARFTEPDGCEAERLEYIQDVHTVLRDAIDNIDLEGG